MRRKDREVTDFSVIAGVIDQCDILRIGLADGDFPYIVPVNFAYTIRDGQVCFYIHGAMAGRKYELMQRLRRCSFEMDIPLQMDCITDKKDVTMRYKCVMGTALIDFPLGEEKQRIIDEIIMDRYEETRHFDYNRSAAARTCVARLTVQTLSCKINPVQGGAD